ncbi:MAG TPA: hypothetical protein VMI94_23730 [Bryobacteraceae bacterium]|nr:hypothetical protein [Bryobacteraceae bacterium]
MRMMIAGLLMAAPYIFAGHTSRCEPVGGSISTNFLDQASTLGVATGSLAGGVGVDIEGTSPGPSPGSLVFHNHHKWVTTGGDTIFFADADATAYPVPELPGLYLLSYMSGVTITGGTGRFNGASGSLQVFGSVNNNAGQIVLRYGGQVCYQSNR